MTVETEIANLTTQTTALLDVVNQQRSSVDGIITGAISAAQLATSGQINTLTATLIDTQALLIRLITTKTLS
jgi:hypothetical protein